MSISFLLSPGRECLLAGFERRHDRNPQVNASFEIFNSYIRIAVWCWAWGKVADLTAVSADIMKIPEMEILKTWCVMTVINGEIVWGTPR